MDVNVLRDNEKLLFSNYTANVAKELSQANPNLTDEINAEMGKSVYIYYLFIYF